MMSDKMNTVNDEDMIRMAFRVLDKDGSGTISSKAFKHLMTHIGKFVYTFLLEKTEDFWVIILFRAKLGKSQTQNL